MTAVGQLNRPAIPPIEGIDDFAGPLFHTARWDKSVDLKGKRVAMIGTGASGMQTGPSIAPDVAHLTVFQRTPHWSMNNPNYHLSVKPGKIWALENIPYYDKWMRFQLFWASSDGFHASLQMDPNWKTPDRSLNEANQKMRELIVDYVRKELDGDEELLAKVIPAYPPYGKRMLRDNHWYRMLKRPNVTLVTGSIARITENVIVMEDGTEIAVDVIILATGFQASKMLWPMHIEGGDGRTIRAAWGDDDPRAYLGITAPGFPNPVHDLRAEHQPGAWRQHHLPHGMPGPLHLPGAARDGGAGVCDAGGPPGRPRRLQSPRRREVSHDGLGASGRDQLVQEPAQPGDRHLAVAAARLLEDDAAFRARGVPRRACRRGIPDPGTGGAGRSARWSG